MLKRRVATNLLSLCSRCLQPSKPAGQSLQYVRGSVAVAANVHTPDSRVIILTLPMLSPTMTQGSLSGWAKNPGDVVEPYDLVYELETETLTEEAYRMGDFAGRVAMEIELVEDAYLAKQLLPVSSKMLPVGTPIGFICEDEEDIEEVAQHRLPTDFNEYKEGNKGMYRIASWQSYLKERKVEPSGGCM